LAPDRLLSRRIRTLEQLSAAGASLWVATNKNRLATGKILSQLGIRRFFREVACRDSRTPVFSTKAEMLIGLMDRRGLAPSECLMVAIPAKMQPPPEPPESPARFCLIFTPSPPGTDF